MPVGLWLGDTENKTMVAHLLADLADRGLSVERVGWWSSSTGPRRSLPVCARSLATPPSSRDAPLHKRRNCADHLPEGERGWVDARLAKAFNHADPAPRLRLAVELARQIETRWVDGAASLREGLEDMFTVHRLGVGNVSPAPSRARIPSSR